MHLHSNIKMECSVQTCRNVPNAGHDVIERSQEDVRGTRLAQGNWDSFWYIFVLPRLFFQSGCIHKPLAAALPTAFPESLPMQTNETRFRVQHGVSHTWLHTQTQGYYNHQSVVDLTLIFSVTTWCSGHTQTSVMDSKMKAPLKH